MALLRIIMLFGFLAGPYLLQADTLPSKRQNYIGIALSKPFSLVNNNLKDEFLFRTKPSLMGTRLQVSTGYEQLIGSNHQNFTRGFYLRAGLQKTFNILGRKDNIYFGLNIFGNHYFHHFVVQPNGQVSNLYFHRESRTGIISVEAELGIVMLRAKNKRFSLECINRGGFLLRRPAYRYYQNWSPGINYYNSNRLYGSPLSICLFYKL